MIALQRGAAYALIALSLPAAGAAETRTTPFTHFGSGAAIALAGDGATATVEFGQRADELVTGATLHLRYAASPALDPAVAHIRVMLNDTVVGVLPVKAGEAGRTVAQDLVVDPRLVVGFNRLLLGLVASKGTAPADPQRPGLWAEVSGSSTLEVAVQPLAVADDLAILPEPFFDKRDQRRVSVPFVFAAKPSIGTLRAAAVVASWLGGLARWRGVRFPVELDASAPGHSIAFVTDTERPAFLAGLAPASGPQLRLMTHPADGRSKLLLVMGRDAAELQLAARALVLGTTALSGAAVNVRAAAESAPRKPYDAPAFLRPDRATRLSELIGWAQQLQATGRAPQLDPIRIELRVPPDLDTGDGPGVPFALKVQYTPPACAADTVLDVAIDDELVQVLPLRTARESITESREVFLPSSRLRGRSQLQVGLRFTPKDEAACRAAQPELVKAALLPDSTIDLSGFAHHARLPALEHFASLGFPFTRMADLSETVVVLPDAPSEADIATMLGLVGRLGEATGVPATGVRVATARDAPSLAGADLLLIGASPQQALLDRWTEGLPVGLSGGVRRVPSEVRFEGTGPVAAILGFESPVTSGRSVVAVTAVVPEQMQRVLDALDDGDLRRAVRGSAAFVLPGKVQSVLAGPTYATGPTWSWAGVRQYVAAHPIVAAVAVIAALALAATMFLRRRRARRWT